jgi:hypothetical protein
MAHDTSKPKRYQNIWLKDLLHTDAEQERTPSWWFLFLPGKVTLWFAYMFPKTMGSVFGSARRIKSPIVQVWFSLLFYAFAIFVLAVGFWQILRS